MTGIFADLSPPELWKHFAALSAIPRRSGEEAAALEYVRNLAVERGVGWRQDEAGNLVLFMDDGDGPRVAVQAHLDMVCEKDPGIAHDFGSDPIPVDREGSRVFARGTTLGADNGIGAAAALALLTSEEVERGPLELVFTIREETGLHGAMAFDAGLLQSKMLINLDSEDPDELTVGCAGGATVQIRPSLSWEPLPEAWLSRDLVVSGLKGGHSGIDIGKRRANAVKVLVSILSGLGSALELRLAGMQGGWAHNVIPREAAARLVVSDGSAGRLDAAVRSIEESLRAEWGESEPGLSLMLQEAEMPSEVLAPGSEQSLLGLLGEIPHGAHEMSEAFPGKVETSSNLARVQVDPSGSLVVASVRSLSPHRLFRTRTAISTAGLKVGAAAEVVDSYPGWEADLDSPLLEAAKQQYEAVNGKPASVQVVHAGLECGVLVSKKEDLQAISFGPLITGAHSPQEQVDAQTVDAMWKLLVGLLKALKDQSR